MKIAVLGSRGIPASYGGFETFAEHLSVGLVEEGHEVVVYCPKYQEYKDPEFKGVRLRFILCLDNLFKNRVFRAASNLLYDIHSLIDAAFSKFDVIYMLGYASGPFLLIPRLLGKKLVVNPDGLEWKSKRWGLAARSWLYLCEWVAARGSDGLVTDAEPIQRHFRERFDVDSWCIPYGAEIPPPPAVRTVESEAEAKYLIIARMVPETSIPMMIRGFVRSGSRRKVIVVGPVADTTFFEEQVRPLIDGEQVAYLGAIYDRAKVTRYRLEAFALLHGHASDGTNPSLLESMACASPVVAINTRSNALVLGDQGDLYFRGEEELATRIRELEALAPEERSRIGASNRRTIVERFSWQMCVTRHVEVFGDVLKN